MYTSEVKNLLGQGIGEMKYKIILNPEEMKQNKSKDFKNLMAGEMLKRIMSAKSNKKHKELVDRILKEEEEKEAKFRADPFRQILLKLFEKYDICDTDKLNKSESKNFVNHVA